MAYLPHGRYLVKHNPKQVDMEVDQVYAATTILKNLKVFLADTNHAEKKSLDSISPLLFHNANST